MAGLVVITRPIDEAREYAQALEAEGFEVLVEPMLEIKPCAFILPDSCEYDGVLVTSANAVRRYVDGGGVVLDVCVYCVGQHTAQAAIDAGFSDVVSVNGIGVDLMNHILGLPGAFGQKFLHICGRHVAFPLVDRLNEAGVLADSLVVYDSVYVRSFSDAFMKALGDGCVEAVTFYSKRTADAFVENAVQSESESLFAGIKSLCISGGVVECVRVLPWASLHVSKTPDRGGMMQILKAYV